MRNEEGNGNDRFAVCLKKLHWLLEQLTVLGGSIKELLHIPHCFCDVRGVSRGPQLDTPDDEI